MIVLEDLELWWEKRNGGLQIINKLAGLIEKYGRKILFIITVNSHAYKSINRFINLDRHMLGTINCYPFNAEELKNIILQRHRSGNMQFVLNGKSEKEIRSWQIAKHFNTCFNYSKGNVGLSLQTWISCIEKAEANTIYIKPPVRPDTSILSKLNAQTLVFLLQFILHKRMNSEKIDRIMFMKSTEVAKQISLLKRAAIITEPAPGVYILNPNLHTFIRERFMEKDLL